MKKIKGVLIGALLIGLGIIFTLNTLEITNINIFFDGWWTLFIILPSIYALFTEYDKVGPLIGLVIGGALLISAQGIVEFTTLLKLLAPVILIIIGVKVIYNVLFKKKIDGHFPKNRPTPKSYTAVFAGHDIRFDGQIFEGATLTAAFGGIEFDLKNAVIDKDVFINAYAVFGGIDVFLPDGVNVKVKTSVVFGGVDYKHRHKHIDGAPTVYIYADAAFGGVEII